MSTKKTKSAAPTSFYSHLECTHNGEIRKIGFSLDGKLSYQVDGERQFVPSSELYDCEYIDDDMIPSNWINSIETKESPLFKTCQSMEKLEGIIRIVALLGLMIFLKMMW